MPKITALLEPRRLAPVSTLLGTEGASYVLRRATSVEDVRRAQRLRYQVFNLELGEGLSHSHTSGLDADPFDAVCDHLLVEHRPSSAVVGTYRMQTGSQAGAALGYYCAREFEFGVYERLRSEVLELGRACIAQEHRNFSVLSLLWRGIASYAQEHGARYLLGCSSLTSQSPLEGAQAFATMQSSLAPPQFCTRPCAGFALEQVHLASRGNFCLPKLLSAYLALGAWVCAPPALDREFRTIDFLTLLDLQSPAMALRRKRFGIGAA
jgi:putative hemolysin